MTMEAHNVFMEVSFAKVLPNNSFNDKLSVRINQAFRTLNIKSAIKWFYDEGAKKAFD